MNILDVKRGQTPTLMTMLAEIFRRLSRLEKLAPVGEEVTPDYVETSGTPESVRGELVTVDDDGECVVLVEDGYTVNMFLFQHLRGRVPVGDRDQGESVMCTLIDGVWWVVDASVTPGAGGLTEFRFSAVEVFNTQPAIPEPVSDLGAGFIRSIVSPPVEGRQGAEAEVLVNGKPVHTFTLGTNVTGLEIPVTAGSLVTLRATRTGSKMVKVKVVVAGR